MKRFISYITIHATVAIAAIVLLAGCDKNEQPAPENDHRTALGVQVIDRGYAPAPGEPADSRHTDTRATENGYKTEFAAGDKVGLYAVKNGALVATCNNLCLTFTTENGTLVWKPSTELTYEDENTSYYAYYPYQTDAYMDGKVNASASDAVGFFAPLVSGWTPDTDQSTSEKYTAQDLMTGSGTVSGTSGAHTLTLGLTHRMALVVINIPAKITYQLSSDADYKWERDISGLTFTNFTPYQKETGIYRLLINPAKAPTLQGSYHTVTEGTRSFTITPAISASAYKTYTPRTTYTPVAGDFLMQDGSLISKDALSDADKGECIGIVFYGGRHKLDRFTDYSTTNIGKKDCHGYVMALADAPTEYHKWATNTAGADQVKVGTSTSTGNWDGYDNQQKIEVYATTNTSSHKITDFPAANACKIYSTTAPTKSTGWFLPSVAQLQGIRTEKDILSASLSKLGSSTFIFTSTATTGHWSSTEYNNESAYYLIMNQSGSNDNYPKEAGKYIRPILAF